MALNVDGKNVVLNEGLDGIDQMSLHSGAPGSAGTDNEVTGAGYARQSVTWAAAANGARDIAAEVTFTIPDVSVTITAIGLWSGTTYCGTVDNLNPATQPFTSGGELIVKSAPVSIA